MFGNRFLQASMVSGDATKRSVTLKKPIQGCAVQRTPPSVFTDFVRCLGKVSPSMNVVHAHFICLADRFSINSYLRMVPASPMFCIRDRERGSAVNSEFRIFPNSEEMKELWLTRACVWLCKRVGYFVATWPRSTCAFCLVATTLLSLKVAFTP